MVIEVIGVIYISRHVVYIISTFTILKTLLLVYHRCNNLNKWPKIKAQIRHIHTYICRHAHTHKNKVYVTQFPTVLPGLGNRKQLFWETKVCSESQTPCLAPNQSHIKYTKPPLQWDCISPANNQHPQAANTHTHSICFIRYISLFTQTG